MFLELKVRNRVEEWKCDRRSMIEKELRKELRIDLEGLKKKRDV